MASPSQWHALSLHTYGPWADSPDKIVEDSLDKVVKPEQIAEDSLDKVVADSRVKVGKDASDDLSDMSTDSQKEVANAKKGKNKARRRRRTRSRSHCRRRRGNAKKGKDKARPHNCD